MIRIRDFLKTCDRVQLVQLVNSDNGFNYNVEEAHTLEELDLYTDKLDCRVICVRPKVYVNNDTLMITTFFTSLFSLGGAA